jgi:hypothetical protein
VKEDLTPEQVASLPPLRPRWLAHVAGLAALAAYCGWVLLVRWLLARAELAGEPTSAWSWAGVVLAVATGALVFLLPLVPFTSRVGLSWGWLVASVLLWPIAFSYAWSIGFRLVRIPWRDWRPARPQRALVRNVPGTSYHVLASDLPEQAGG